jgi:hypothetical protein
MISLKLAPLRPLATSLAGKALTEGFFSARTAAGLRKAAADRRVAAPVSASLAHTERLLSTAPIVPAHGKTPGVASSTPASFARAPSARMVQARLLAAGAKRSAHSGTQQPPQASATGNKISSAPCVAKAQAPVLLLHWQHRQRWQPRLALFAAERSAFDKLLDRVMPWPSSHSDS